MLSRFVGPDRPDSAELSLCVRCGFCLNVCPTYLELGVEMDSPRGRLSLMRALEEGRVEPTPRVLRYFDQCLQCRACESACPSGVPYGRLMEATRADLFQQGRRSRRQRLLWDLVMRRLVPSPRRLRWVALGLRIYQRWGLQRLVRASGMLRLVAPRLAEVEAMAPDATRPFFRPGDERRYAPPGTPRARVALLSGCVMPLLYGATHHATARVLSRNGAAVTAPKRQVCCGALHAHSGDLETARALARRDIDVFLAEDPAAIIVNAAGCGSHMKEHGHLLRNDVRYARKAERFAGLVRDVHEYLLKEGFDAPGGALQRSVTYQDSCHLVHGQKVREAPRAVLRAIPGLELREMAHPDQCCGSAGIYSVVQRGLAGAILAEKMAEIDATGAEAVCTANPGCMMQLDAGLRLQGRSGGPRGRTLHVIELLDESYRLAEGEDYAARRESF